MSKIKNLSRAAWFIVGVVVTLLLVPTVAVATGITYTGIEGTSGTATNKASVTIGRQLLTTAAAPSSFYNSLEADVTTGGETIVTSPPSGSALIVTTIEMDVYSDPSPGVGNLVGLVVETGTSCSGSVVGSFSRIVNPASVGEIDLNLNPGLGVPSGDGLCANISGSVESEVAVVGYLVPSTDVPAEAVHPFKPLVQR